VSDLYADPRQTGDDGTQRAMFCGRASSHADASRRSPGVSGDQATNGEDQSGGVTPATEPSSRAANAAAQVLDIFTQRPLA